MIENSIKKNGVIYTVYIPYKVRQRMLKVNALLAKKNQKINWSNIATQIFDKTCDRYLK